MKGLSDRTRSSRVNQLVADAVKVSGGLFHGLDSAVPAAPGQGLPVGAEHGVRLLPQQQALFLVVQDLVAGPQPHQGGMRLQEPVAQAVDGGDVYSGEVSSGPRTPAPTM